MEEPAITKARSAFSLMCGVKLIIHADPGRIWGLLTNAEDFPRWNSTIASIEGRIAEGQSLRLVVPGIDRPFTPKVSGFVPDERMTWTGGIAPVFKGVRTFELKARDQASTEFAMEERFSGLLLPLIGPKLPDFAPIFARIATDLRNEAERAAN